MNFVLKDTNMNRSVYLDNAATTPLDPRVLEAMLPFLKDDFGNANSPHSKGQKAHVAVEDAREKIASYLGSDAAEIIFTSGGTESNNAAIKGVIKATGKKHVVTSRVEHHAVLHPIQYGRKDGITGTYLDVRPLGHVTAEQVENAITDETALVSLMHGNNEIGSINPLKAIAEICKRKGVAFHSDTVQTMGKIPVKVNELGVDLLSISAHKIYGPKGVGVLYVRSGTPWSAWMEGGSQERRRRGGTLNVPGIIGLAKALELSIAEMDQNRNHIHGLKKRLVQGLKEKFPDLIAFNGDVEHGLYNIVNCSFPLDNEKSLDGEMLLLNLDIEGICCSNGSACTSGAIDPSHVLMALGMVTPTAKSSLRFSIGKGNTTEDINYTLDKLDTIVNRMLKTIEN
jgi:cysteine desulfurase